MQRQVGPHSLRPLLDRDDNCKMLVINGTAHALVPVEDTLVFSGRRDTLAVLADGESGSLLPGCCRRSCNNVSAHSEAARSLAASAAPGLARARIRRRRVLGGLIHEYERAA